jgi:hypothetical protein
MTRTPMEMSKLSPAARSAAMRGGTSGWGEWASSAAHVRYMEPVPSTSRRRCPCCKRRATHMKMANGISLGLGCELYVRRWVKG